MSTTPNGSRLTPRPPVPEGSAFRDDEAAKGNPGSHLRRRARWLVMIGAVSTGLGVLIVLWHDRLNATVASVLEAGFLLAGPPLVAWGVCWLALARRQSADTSGSKLS